VGRVTKAPAAGSSTKRNSLERNVFCAFVRGVVPMVTSEPLIRLVSS
jgi:hypothetical protein